MALLRALVHYHRIRRLAHQHRKTAVGALHKTHKHAKRLFRKHKLVIHHVRQHTVRSAALAGLSATMLAAPTIGLVSTPKKAEAQSSAHALQQHIIAESAGSEVAQIGGYSTPAGPDKSLANTHMAISAKLSELVPVPKAVLPVSQEEKVTAFLSQQLHIPITAELEGMRLNTNYGIIAGEQHLPLYPGDSIQNHITDPTKQLTGMVPGLPSWGYFAPNAGSVTVKDKEREQYYIAAQTFLAPGWDQNVQKMYSWFKYRKMVIVNPENGLSVVVVIGDAGPSPFTKKSYGGSNEVLIGLGLGSKRKGPVYAYFVNDPDDTIPLGPRGGE